MNFNVSDLLWQAPILVLVTAGLLLVLADAFFLGRNRSSLMGIAVVGSVGAALAAVFVFRELAPGQARSLMSGMLVADRTGMFLLVLFSAATGLTAMLSPAHQREHQWEGGEYYGLLLLSATGMGILAMAGDLVTIFIGIEAMSLAVYVLTASRRRSRRSNEAAIKYFLMGAFSTGFLLYGIALIYGATGTTNLASIQAIVSSEGLAALPMDPPAVVVIGLFMLIVAFGFKVAAVPFHMWAPDAYEGAPTPVTAFMAAAVKAAAFAAMIRIFGDTFGGDVWPFGQTGWAGILAVIAAITMTVGNIAAIRQANIKRMLAYSSVSHAGVLLCGLVAIGVGGAEAGGEPAMLFYLAAYSVTTLGAFGVVVWVGSRGRERLLIDDWNGLAGKHPAAALAMVLFMLSLGGIPPTAGFFGKFYIFKALVQADSQLLWLAVIGVLNAFISIYYYLRVVMAMYFRPQVDEFRPMKSGAVVFVLVICALLVIEMGILPGWWLAQAGG